MKKWIKTLGTLGMVAIITVGCSVLESQQGTAGLSRAASVQSALDKKIAVQRIVTDLGIEVWLVEEHSIPILSVQFAFDGGTFLDPVGKESLSYMVAGLLDEGAGPYSSIAFRKELEENSIGIGYSASLDAFQGSMSTLSANKGHAIDLLQLSLTKPRFDNEPVERVRGQYGAVQARAKASPGEMGAKALFKDLFGDQGYARRPLGTPESLDAITTADLKSYVAANLTQDRLKIAVVGDITPDELKIKIDQAFGGLPATGAALPQGDEDYLAKGGTIVVPFKNPQSSVTFAGAGPKIDDEDFIPSYVMNHTLGGGTMTSRLNEEVRVKRGLTYSVYSYFLPYKRAGLFMGGVASDNAKVAEAINVIKTEITKMRDQGISEQELDDAKTYLTGAFVLRFDSNSKIASQILGYQMLGLGIDYVNRRNELINQVTLEDIRRVAQKLPTAEELTFVVVGQPEGL